MNGTLRGVLRNIAIGALPLFAGCTLEPPGAPVWTVELTVPFSERVYRMGELITDSAKLQDRGWGVTVNPVDSVLSFEFRDSLDYQAIGDRITYDASDVGRYSNRIGFIHVEEPDPDIDTINISEANALLQPGYTGPVAPFSLSQAEDTMRFNIFHWVAVRSGWLRMTVVNTYPFDVQNLTVAISNVENGRQLGTIVFPRPIRPGESMTDSLNLGGNIVYNALHMTANANSPGSAVPITIRGNESLSILIGVSSTDVDSAEAEIAEQSFSNPDQLSIDSRNKIITANIKSGNAFFRLTNTTRMKITTEMVFENFFDSTGSPIRKTITLNPESRGELSQISLSNATVNMPLNDQGLRVSNHVTIEDSRTTRYRGNTYQVITGDQGVDVEYWTDNLTLSSFEGIPDSIRIDIPEFVTDVNFPQGLDAISFTSDTVFVSIFNETQMRLKLSLGLQGSNRTDHTSYGIPVNADLVPGLNRIVVPNADSITSILPDRIEVVGWAGIGKKFFPLEGVSRIDETQGFSGMIQLRTGLRFFLNSDTILTKPDSLEEALDYPLEGASITLNIKNKIPLGGIVELMMGNDTTNMVAVISAEIPRGDIVNKRVPVAIELSRTEELDQSEMEMMKHLPLYTRQRMILFGNNNQLAWVYGDDALSVQASATVHYFVNPNK